MELIRNINGSLSPSRGCVVTIGNFDGVHLGHQSVIRQLGVYAQAHGLDSVVITFEPLPLEFFSPTSAPARLTGFREKIEFLQGLSVDKVVCLRFNATLASLSAEAFIEQVLVQGLAVRALIVGDDFRFGKNREGNTELLRQAGISHGFELIPAETYHYNGVRVSSSLVRGHLAIGDFDHASALLGRRYCMSGKVIHGDKRGKTLGFPTANLACNRVNSPLAGVYVVRVHGLEGGSYDGVANIGTRPVFAGEHMLLETYILDFDQDIYGRRITLEFLRHLRDERDFSSVEELCRQMEKDVQKARTFLESNSI